MALARTIDDGWRESRARGNNFDALRLAAAAAVIVSHSFEIVGGPGALEPIRALTADDTSLGRVAVMTFFVLSGFLLTRSFASGTSLLAFATKRALRIAPGLFAVVLAAAFVVGPLFTAAPMASYLRTDETWLYLANLGFYTGFETLPGVFADLPFAGVVNGPLWTLKFEVLCYLTLAAVGAARLLNARIAFCLFIFFYLAGAAFGDGPHQGALYYLAQYADLARPFFAGVLYALLAGKIALTPVAAIAAAAGLVVAAPAGLFSDAFPLFGGYLILWLAFARLGPLRRAGCFGDFSYGLYLWGWPAQQIVQRLFEPTDWSGNVALALPLALSLAILSWLLVEKPALGLKARLVRMPLKPLPSAKRVRTGIEII